MDLRHQSSAESVINHFKSNASSLVGDDLIFEQPLKQPLKQRENHWDSNINPRNVKSLVTSMRNDHRQF